MTREEVRAFIEAECRRVAGEAMIALLVDLNREHPAARFVIEHGGQEAANGHSRAELRDARIGKRAAELWLTSLVDKLTHDACLRLPDPGQRTLVAIKDAAAIP